MTLRSKEKKDPGSSPSSLSPAVREPCFLPEEPGALGQTLAPDGWRAREEGSRGQTWAREEGARQRGGCSRTSEFLVREVGAADSSGQGHGTILAC